MLSLSHVVDDLYLGAIPAILPFLVLERGYSYTSAAGITLAATLVSSVAQPAFGMLADRKSLPLLTPFALLLVGSGVGAIGLITTYWLVWVAVALAGVGVAAYHPSAARAARAASGASAQGISIFALGGNIGLALGPAIATPLLLAWGLGSTPLLTIPAVVMAAILIRMHRVTVLRAAQKPKSTGESGPHPCPMTGHSSGGSRLS
jgi:FSR family fosmidomycin resistance protein-like MFS transporter